MYFLKIQTLCLLAVCLPLTAAEVGWLGHSAAVPQAALFWGTAALCPSHPAQETHPAEKPEIHPTAVPVDGKPFAAKLTAIDAKWQLHFAADNEKKPFAAADLVRWGKFAEPAEGSIVVMADGGLLVADVFGLDEENLAIGSMQFGTMEIPIECVAGVVFDPPTGARERDLLLDRVATTDGPSDRLLLHNGDMVTGLIRSFENDVIEVDTDIGPPKVEASAVAAMVFDPALRQETVSRGLRAWVGLANGSLLLAKTVTMTEKSLAITTTGGQVLKTTPDQLAGLQPLGGRAVYLSDLDADHRHLPFLSLRWPYHVDRNVTAGRLRSGKRLYLKGLGVHSTARLTYRLDGTYGRFQADLGIDDSTEGRGSVRFRVYIDRKPIHLSKTIRGGDLPVPVSLDITGAKTLDLVVDYADRADQLDHANWLDARIIKE